MDTDSSSPSCHCSEPAVRYNVFFIMQKLTTCAFSGRLSPNTQHCVGNETTTFKRRARCLND